MTFEKWLRAIDLLLIDMIGLTQDELPDWPTRDTFDSGASPKEGARVCLEYAFEYMDMEELIDEL